MAGAPTRDAPPPLPADLVTSLLDAHAAWTCFADQRNSLPSRSMRWRMTESFRATATVAFLVPIRLASTTVEFTYLRVISLGLVLDRSEAASEGNECF